MPAGWRPGEQPEPGHTGKRLVQRHDTMANIDELIEFVNRGRVASPSMAAALKKLGKLRLRVLCVRLLSCMKARYRSGETLTLIRQPTFEWETDLVILMTECNFLKDFINLDDNTVSWHGSLGKQERQRLLQRVDRGYQPRVCSPPRRLPGRFTGGLGWLAASIVFALRWPGGPGGSRNNPLAPDSPETILDGQPALLRGSTSMTQLDSLYAELLEAGFVLLRRALDLGRRDWVGAEITFLHKVPTLLGEGDIGRHRDFWEHDRTQYVD